MPRSRRGLTVAIHGNSGSLLRYVHAREIKAMFKAGQIVQINTTQGVMWFATKDFPFYGTHPLGETTGKVVEQIAIEKHPQIFNGGLTRTEHKPRINKHIPRLRRWFTDATQSSSDNPGLLSS